MSASRWRSLSSPPAYASSPEAPASAPVRAAPSARVSRPCRWRYAAEASVTTAAIISRTTASPTISTVTEPRSSRHLRSATADLLELTDRDRLGRVEGEARAVATQGTRHQRQHHPRVHRDGDHRGALVTVAGVWRAGDADVRGHAVDALVVERHPSSRSRAHESGLVVRGERVRPRGGSGRSRDREGATLDLEHRHHDPQHRQHEQDPEPRHLDQGTPALVATSGHGCSSTAWPETSNATAGPPRPSAGTTT